MAPRQQWFETLRLSIRQEHGEGWSVREIGATNRNPVGRRQPTRIEEERNLSLNAELLGGNQQQNGEGFAG